VEADDGTVLFPWEDTITVVTYRREQEPNDSRPLADTMIGTIFGTIESANDTDWFAAPDPAVRFFYLVSSGSSSMFDLRDAKGASARPPIHAQAETLAVPAGFALPLNVVVYAYKQSSGGYYKAGWIK
jgi:hypothetical protein